MYTPAHFAETHPQALHQLVQAYPLGALVTHGPHGLDANHLPFELDASAAPHGRLLAHVARANPVWQQVQADEPVLVIFRAGQGYISPNWYPSKQVHHEQVPTWNYQVVHVHGTLTVRDDEKFVRGLVGRLTRTHEARAGGEQPWKMSDAPSAYLQRMLAAIVGIEITITRWEGKSKLSQNKELADRQGAVAALQTLAESNGTHADPALLQAMRQTLA